MTENLTTECEDLIGESFLDQEEDEQFSANGSHPELNQVAALLADVEGTIRRYVHLAGDHEGAALALFVAHTYALDGAHATPYLLVTSPEKRSGKSRLLEVLELLVDQPDPPEEADQEQGLSEEGKAARPRREVVGQGLVPSSSPSH